MNACQPIRLIAALALFAFIGCGHTPSSPVESDQGGSASQERERTANLDAVSEQLDALATRHNAVRDWPGFDHKEGDAPQVFSLEFQDSLDRLRGRPAIVVCRVTDVFRNGGTYNILAEVIHPGKVDRSDSNVWPAVSFLLECNEAVARQVIRVAHENAERSAYERVFAFAVLPSRLRIVYRREQIAEGKIVDDNSDERYAAAEIVESEMRVSFEIRGRCLEFVYLEKFDTF